jgi:hypothetical protein
MSPAPKAVEIDPNELAAELSRALRIPLAEAQSQVRRMRAELRRISEDHDGPTEDEVTDCVRLGKGDRAQAAALLMKRCPSIVAATAWVLVGPDAQTHTNASEERSGVTTMAEPKLIDLDPARWAVEVSRLSGRPLSDCQAEAMQLAQQRRPQAPPDLEFLARVEQKRAERSQAIQNDAYRILRENPGLDLAQAQQAALRASAAASPPQAVAPPAAADLPLPPRTARAIADCHEAARQAQARLRAKGG